MANSETCLAVRDQLESASRGRSKTHVLPCSDPTTSRSTRWAADLAVEINRAQWAFEPVAVVAGLSGFSHERLRIFSSPLREALNAQLAWENQGLVSASVPAIQFLQERRIALQGAVKEASPRGTRADEPTAFLPAKPSLSPDESGMSLLDKRREELERGAGGDHDLPYRFTLPTSMPQVLAWVKLLARVQQGDFQPEAIACGSGNTSDAHYWTLHTYVCTVWEEAGTMRLHSHNGVNDERLVALKNTYDPTNFFALHQQMKPLTNERIEDEQVDT